MKNMKNILTLDWLGDLHCIHVVMSSSVTKCKEMRLRKIKKSGRILKNLENCNPTPITES